MPTPRLVTINAWSYSRFQTYDQCPFKAKCLYIDKLKEPDNNAGIEGNRVHVLAAAYTSGQLPQERENAHLLPALEKMLKGKQVPTELETFAEEFKALKKAKALVEQQWTFNRDWNYLPPPNGWFSPQAWLRVKVDVHWIDFVKNGKLRKNQGHVRDHKTGKESSDHALQRSLYALGMFLVYPDLSQVDVSHWYLGLGKESPLETWERGQLDALKKEWLDRTTAMLNDTTFAPNPNPGCKWCAFSKAKGGPCQY